MISVRIRDANLVLGEPEEWDRSRGDCSVMYGRRAEVHGTTVTYTAWKPSAQELQSLILGGTVVLGVLGDGHPPVLMYVSTED